VVSIEEATCEAYGAFSFGERIIGLVGVELLEKPSA